MGSRQRCSRRSPANRLQCRLPSVSQRRLLHFCLEHASLLPAMRCSRKRRTMSGSKRSRQASDRPPGN